MAACNLCSRSFGEAAHVRWRKDGFDIVECPGCSLIFRVHPPSRDEVVAIYDESYFSQSCGDTGGQGYLDYIADEESHRGTARRRLELLRRFRQPGRLLDVGAAAGFFVDEARRGDWTASGVDVAETMVEWGRRNLEVDLELGDIGELEFPPESFDAVTMWDYIEHSRDPNRDIRAAHELLRPRGVLALSTGDIESRMARLCGSRWHLLTPRHHNFFFSSHTLQALLEANGFAIRNVDHPGAAYKLSYLAHKTRTALDSGATRAVARALERSALGQLAIPVNLRDIVTVVASRSE